MVEAIVVAAASTEVSARTTARSPYTTNTASINFFCIIFESFVEGKKRERSQEKRVPIGSKVFLW